MKMQTACAERGVDLRRLMLEAVVKTAMDEGREDELLGLRSGVVQSMRARDRNAMRVDKMKVGAVVVKHDYHKGNKREHVWVIVNGEGTELMWTDPSKRNKVGLIFFFFF